jgi:RES domain-containing protein
MTDDLAAVASAARVYRVARPDVWCWPDWAYAGPDGTFGNRWDDPQGTYRVLYACSERIGAFVETLARFRPAPSVVTGLAAITGAEDTLPAGVLAGPSWTSVMLRRSRS